MDFDLTKEQQNIANATREFSEGDFPERAEEFDRDETSDEIIFKKAVELGFVGTFIDEEYENAGLMTTEQCILQSKPSSRDLIPGAPFRH